MDIEKIRKLSKNASEAGELVKAVTAYKNELKDKKQMHDVVMSEHFKTLREPLLEQQKKTDEKQDQVIDQLKKNQLALTSGIQDIMTLNLELPQIAPEELPAPNIKVYIANLGKTYTAQDLEALKQYNLVPPSGLLNYNYDELQDHQDDLAEIRRKIKNKLTGLGNTTTRDTTQEIEELKKVRDNEKI